MDLSAIMQSYMTDGIGDLDAAARTAQDVMLVLIAKAGFSKNVTIKGGVVMQHISNNIRRATQDIDFDFIKYSIEEKSIRAFVGKLDMAMDNISVAVTGDMEDLKHHDYRGKRIHVSITDVHGFSIKTKVDIGVHKDVDIEQTEYCFKLGKMDDSVSLLANTKEQIVLEKLKSLLRIGTFTTRFKDIFDLYYLLVVEGTIKKHFLQSAVCFDGRQVRQKLVGYTFRNSCRCPDRVLLGGQHIITFSHSPPSQSVLFRCQLLCHVRNSLHFPARLHRAPLAHIFHRANLLVGANLELVFFVLFKALYGQGCGLRIDSLALPFFGFCILVADFIACQLLRGGGFRPSQFD